MHAENMTLKITGTRRLLTHAGRLADPLDPIAKDIKRLTSKRAKTEADHLQISKVEWHGSLWLDSGRPCIPAEALMATFVAAAKSEKLGMQAKAGLIVMKNAPLEYDGPRRIEKLWESGEFMFRTLVKVGNAKTLRTRAKFEKWGATFDVHYFPSILDPERIVDLFTIAGVMRGIGDWRPQNGTFAVERVK